MKLFIDLREKEDIIKYSLENLKEDVEEIIEVAEKVSGNVFLFNFPWDMERTHEPVHFEKEINWKYMFHGDEEWTFMLNRHRYWVALGQAYWLTGNEKYAETFCKQLEHWIDNNPNVPENRPYSWRTLEAGIRCENWLKAYQYFYNSPYFTEELFLKMKDSLKEHCKYIYESNSPFKTISNWGIIEVSGLFIASIFLKDLKEAEIWREESLRRLLRFAQTQVPEDGIQWEQSFMYHNEVYHAIMNVVIIAQNNGIEIDGRLEKICKSMAYANLYIKKPNHKQPLKGDSDDTDLRDMITSGAILFRDGVLKFGGFDKVDFNSLYTFGMKAVELYDYIEAKEPEHTSYGFNQSGTYVMRNSWEENSNLLYFNCGVLGGGHGHGDMLHFDLNLKGYDVLNDSGRYTYVEDNPWRHYFKGCKAHNVGIVDGMDFTECVGSWGFGRMADAFDDKWISTKDYDYVQAAHDGYRFLEDPVYHFRKILFVKPYYWVLVDTFRCKGEHNIDRYFHFAPGEIVLDERNVCESKYDHENNIRIIPMDKNINGQVLDTYISPSYNKMEKNKTLLYNSKIKGDYSFITLLIPKTENEKDVIIENVSVYDWEGRELTENVAKAIKVKYKNTENTIVICNKRPLIHRDSYVIEGNQIFGEIVLIKKIEKEEEILVIK